MEKTQRIILTILIVAILFSAASIFISYNTLKNIGKPSRVVGHVTGGDGGAGLNLVVERLALPLGIKLYESK